MRASPTPERGLGGGVRAVDVLEDRRVATVLNGDPAFDPKNERLRA